MTIETIKEKIRNINISSNPQFLLEELVRIRMELVSILLDLESRKPYFDYKKNVMALEEATDEEIKKLKTADQRKAAVIEKHQDFYKEYYQWKADREMVNTLLQMVDHYHFTVKTIWDHQTEE